MTGLIAHEWIERSGGAEKVLDEFAATYPDADMAVLWNDAPDRYNRAVNESWFARTPLRRHKALALPLMPLVWRGISVERRPDWILVSSHLFAHHLALREFNDVPKLTYVHTPARYIWNPELDDRGSSLPVRIASSALKPLDRRRARESVDLAANSEFTRKRVEQAWRRDARVIYPPVDTQRITSVDAPWKDRLSESEAALLASLPSGFILGASRFVPYKRLDLVISCGEANRMPVVLAGHGPDRRRLEERAKTASVPVRFIDHPSDELLFALYQEAVAFVFPAVEDFGIMPVEAMAAGTPVIVPTHGGAAESATLLEGGASFEADSPSSWRDAVQAAEKVDRDGLPARASAFSNAAFRDRIRTWVEGATSISN